MAVGKVMSTEKDVATVIIERQDMCGECHACDVVGEKKSCEIRCINCCESKVGDTVEIELENNLFLKATFIMYGIPLVALFVGLGFGFLIATYFSEGYKEIVMIITGVLAMIITFMIIKKRDYKKKYEALLPRIVKIVD